MPTHLIVRDIETRSVADLSDVGVHNYAMHPSTEVLCVGFCLDDKPPKPWHPGEPVPAEILQAANNNGKFVAHNVAFEMAIERHILTPKFGFPEIPIERNFCTMAAATAMALPAALEKCATALNLEFRKDVVGKRAMLQVTKPRKARKTENPDGVYWYDDQERLARVDTYCLNDVLTERELYRKLTELIPEEFELWLLDQRINERGFFIDLELANAARKIAEEAYPALNAEINQITEGAVTAVTQVARLIEWLHRKRVDTDVLDRETIELLLKTKQKPDVKRALQLRLLGAQAAVKKVDALLLRQQPDGRVRGAFQFHSAGTGRWSSKGVQVHNLKRLPDDFDIGKAIQVVSKGSYNEALRSYPNPLEIIGTLMRPMICAPPGQILWGADFSGVESRVTAWLAGEESKLDIFRQYDAGTGPDPYIVTAAKILRKDVAVITKAERQSFGKPPELAFGFQGGVGAFRKFATHDFTDEEIEEFKTTWRKAHPKIVDLWYNLNEQSRDAIRTGQYQSIGQGKLTIDYNKETKCGLPVMWITLPSGRDIIYPDARIYTPDSGPLDKRTRGIHFFDNTSGQWRRVKVYGGLLTENVVQGVARDLLAAALMRLDAAGFKIVLHVHDEVVVEEPETSKQFEEFTRLMNVIPDWAKGLPVVSKSWQDKRYIK